MYDVIVVKGGHAGCGTTLACARKGYKTLLVTGNIKNVPCNSLISRLAEGIVVRKIKVYGEEIGRNRFEKTKEK